MSVVVKRLMLVLAMLCFASAAQAKNYLPGVHYKVLDVPVATVNPDVIEVREFFFYGCPHCYHAQPLVNKWSKTLADDVDFEKTPVLFMRGGDVMAHAFYIAKSQGILDQVHNALFDAVNAPQPGRALFQKKNLAKWFADHGISEDKFNQLYSSLGIKSKVKQAKATTRESQITGVPAFIVDGRYLVLRSNLSGEQETFQAIDFLVNKVRQQRAER